MTDAGEQLEAPSADETWLRDLERQYLVDRSVEEALARMRARWSHPPVDRADIEERLAVRLIEAPAAEVLVLGPWPPLPACRLFVRHPKGWRSRYVHAVAEVDAALDWCRP